MNDFPVPIPTAYTIRRATDLDVDQINGIINYEIAVSINNVNYGPRSVEDALAWFRATIAGGYPIFVATTTTAGEDGEGGKEIVVGYSSLGCFRPRDGFRFTAEYSLYIHHEHRRRGLGRRLLKDILIEAKLLNFHSIIGSASEGNDASVNLAKAFGFRIVGTMKENAYKFGRWIDNIFFELLFV
ncbi:MAG: acyl-CoA N-acyltransferase [Linnemannia gamsii]|nr:MAG: acyl-CoA N-acyltransferase [Linnemannia gamsii]